MTLVSSQSVFNEMKKRTDSSLLSTLGNIIYYVANQDKVPDNITTDDYMSAYGDGSVETAFPVLGAPPAFLDDPTNQYSNTFFKHYQLWGKVSEFISASLHIPKIIPEEYVIHLSCKGGAHAESVARLPLPYPPPDVPEGYFTRPEVLEVRSDGSMLIKASKEEFQGMVEQAAKDAAAKSSDQ